MRQLYLITCGKNVFGRQLYLNGYVDDKDAWDISVVPIPMTKTKCNQIIKKAEKDLVELRKKFPRRYLYLENFEISEYVDTFISK